MLSIWSLSDAIHLVVCSTSVGLQMRSHQLNCHWRFIAVVTLCNPCLYILKFLWGPKVEKLKKWTLTLCLLLIVKWEQLLVIYEVFGVGGKNFVGLVNRDQRQGLHNEIDGAITYIKRLIQFYKLGSLKGLMWRGNFIWSMSSFFSRCCFCSVLNVF